jgi:glycosyltransferase involved in cell wall biosynthesis
LGFILSRTTLPLRVLHIISGDLWAGAEVQAYTLLTALRNLTDVEVAAVLMNDGELARRLTAAGVPVTIVDESTLGPYQILERLRAQITHWRPDVVHTHRSKENVLGALANRLSLNVPSVRTAHGASEHRPTGMKALLRHRLIGGLDRWCARHAQERVIAVSRELAVRLAAELPQEKIVVVENGVDLDAVAAQVRPVELRAAQPEAVHVGIVGRLVPVKRVDLFLQTAALLLSAQAGCDWRFHVFGDGPLRLELTRLAAQLELGDSVTFHGHRSDIVACMAALDMLVMCSDHEGLPMTALEAAVVGVPLVAHAVGGLLDVLPESCLVHAHDAAGYAHAIRTLRAGGGREAAAFAAQRVRADYSSARNAASIKAIYADLRASARAAGC